MGFLKNAFNDMKKSAQEQHKIDKANLEAIKQINKDNIQAAKEFKRDDLNEFKEAEGVIEKAKVGLYNSKSIASVPEEFKKKYFTKVGTSYRIADEIKARVEFKESNLLKDPYPMGCHLIVCRNVLIYFTEEAKDEVFRKFYKSLAKEGILFIGSTEQIMNYKEIGYGRLNSFFYISE